MSTDRVERVGRLAWVGRVMIAFVVLFALGAPLAFVAQLASQGPRPHEAVLAISGPALVAQAIATRADALPGHPFDARVLPEGDPSARSVAAGIAQAGLMIDFRLDRDVLVVSTTTDPDLVAEYRVLLEAIDSSYGRTLRTQTVPPAGAEDAPRGLPYVLTFLWVLLGVGLAVGLSLWRGPVAATTARGAERLIGLGACGVLVGVLGAVVAPDIATGEVVWVAALGALVVLVTSWLVLAFEAVLGLGGLALMTAVLVGLSTPLLTFTEPSTLPSPWAELAPWTPHGAAFRLARQHVFFGVHADIRSWAVLLAWSSIAVVALVGARWVRPPSTYARSAGHVNDEVMR